ncbi:MAG: hypothetical protein JW762_10630 [Dehalococcoidales bacterium]|nr:hypothetical protein [Dehalococcoidales bacterium]
MKKKFTKLMGIALTITLAVSLMISAVPAAALTQPQVSIPYGTAVIDVTTTYSVTFTAGLVVPTNGHIVVTFPAGTDISAVDAADVMITALAGLGGGDGTTGAASDITKTMTPGAPQVLSINMTAGKDIGQGSLVGLAIADVKNPATPGDYTLTVGTSGNQTPPVPIEAAVTSSTYTITAPILQPLAGVVLAYNSAGILMSQGYSIQAGIIAAGVGGTVEVGPGTFDETVTASINGQTIIGTGAPGEVIIKDLGSAFPGNGTLTITGGPAIPGGTTGVTVDNIKIVPSSPVAQNIPLLHANGAYAVIQNCYVTAGTNDAIQTDDITTISNTMIDTPATGGQIGIDANAQTKVMDCTINVGLNDTAIDSAGGTPGPTASLVSGTTITGSSGVGVLVTAGVITIDKSTLMSLNTALDINSGTVTVKNSIIDTCGGATPGSGNAIDVAAGTVTMSNNTIQNSAAANWAMLISGGTVKAHFNNILNNTKNITTTVAANATHNWWGDASGPAPLSTGGGTLLALIPYLGNSVTDASVSLTGSVVAKDTVGVDATVLTSTGTAGTAQVLAVAKYAGNPELTPPTIKGTGSILGYFDVYAAGVTGATVQVKFYLPVTPYTKVYYAGGISGRWVELTSPSAGVNTASGYAYANIGSASTQLNITDLGGTVFAIVEDKSTGAGPVQTSPTIGSYDVATEPMFTWNGVLGSIRYEIALSEDPTFTIIEWSYNVDQTFYKVDEPLRYDTTYYWRVRGVLGEPYQQGGQWLTPATPWTTGIFTTASEPAPPPDPIVVQPTKPEVNVEIPPTKITIEPAEQAIPNYMLWIIVVVGALLIIALIVLIVRTRRVV